MTSKAEYYRIASKAIYLLICIVVLIGYYLLQAAYLPSYPNSSLRTDIRVSQYISL